MEKIQNYWVESFLTLIDLCKIKTNESIIVLTETRSRELNVIILEQAIKKIGLEFIKIEIPSKPYLIDPIVKSTGASNILDGNNVYIKKLKESDIMFDLTKDGLMHSKQAEIKDTAEGIRQPAMLFDAHASIVAFVQSQ